MCAQDLRDEVYSDICPHRRELGWTAVPPTERTRRERGHNNQRYIYPGPDLTIVSRHGRRTFSSSQRTSLPHMLTHPQGNLGIPPDLPSATETITPSQPDINLGSNPVVPVINVFHQFATKLSVHHARRQPEDYADLEFLAETYPTEIFAVRNFLDKEHCEAFWLDYAARNAMDDVAVEGAARVRRLRVLLGLSMSP